MHIANKLTEAIHVECLARFGCVFAQTSSNYPSEYWQGATNLMWTIRVMV